MVRWPFAQFLNSDATDPHRPTDREAGATGMKGKEQAMPTMSNASEALAAAVRRTLVSGSPSAPITREASCCLERPPAGIEASIETTPREWAGREVAGIARFRADDNPTSAVSRLHSCTFPDTSITTSSSTRTQPQPLQRRQQASFETPAESCSPAEVCDLSARQRTLHPHVTHEDLGESLASELLDKAQQIAHQYSPSKFLGKDVKVWDKENESQQEMPAAAQRQKRTTIFSPAVVPSPPSRNLGGRRASFRVTRFFERPTSDPDKEGTDSECQNIAINHPFFSAAVKPTQTAPVLSSSQEDGSVFRERSGCDSCADSDSDQTTANNTSEICDTSASLPFTISVDVSDKAKIGISSAHPCGTDSRDHTFQIEGRLCSEPANSWRESGGHSLSPVFQAGGSAPPTAKAFGIDPTSVEVPVPPPRPPSDTLSIRSLNDAYSPPGKQVPESKDWFLFALISEISELLRGPGDPDTDCLAEKASTMSRSYAMPQASAAGESPVKVQLTPSSLLKPMAQVPRRKNEVPGKMAGFFDRCCDGCLSARENKQRIQMTGSLGIALEVDKEKKCMVVVGLDPHGPAARSGRVQLGDEIISIGKDLIPFVVSESSEEISITPDFLQPTRPDHYLICIQMPSLRCETW